MGQITTDYNLVMDLHTLGQAQELNIFTVLFGFMFCRVVEEPGQALMF